jgi:putative transposase
MTLIRGTVTGEYYHIYNRSAHKVGCYCDQRDLTRFLFSVLYFQSPTPFPNISRIVRSYDPGIGFPVSNEDFESVIAGRAVELVSFCIMPNHYHLLVRELIAGGLGRYMHRVDLAYTKYFNTKYERTGHVFQGTYHSKHVSDNEYLTHLSAYIHKNPRELKTWKGREAEYPWSSYQDYVKENRWGGLLAQEIILDQFEGTKKSNYADFIKSTPVKGHDLPY